MKLRGGSPLPVGCREGQGQACGAVWGCDLALYGDLLARDGKAWRVHLQHHVITY